MGATSSDVVLVIPVNTDTAGLRLIVRKDGRYDLREPVKSRTGLCVNYTGLCGWRKKMVGLDVLHAEGRVQGTLGLGELIAFDNELHIRLT